MSRTTIPANPNRLHPTWYHDPDHAASIYTAMGRMISRGIPLVDIARYIGCSERTVQRFKARRVAQTGETA